MTLKMFIKLEQLTMAKKAEILLTSALLIEMPMFATGILFKSTCQILKLVISVIKPRPFPGCPI